MFDQLLIKIDVFYLVKRPKCNANECWCINNGGYTCGPTKDKKCAPGECADRNNCKEAKSHGYWCEDSSNKF